MSDAISLPSDFFVPEVCLEYFGFEFYSSLGVMETLTGGDQAPIKIVNFGQLKDGGQFVQAPIFKEVASLVTRRDITSAADIDTLKLEGRNDRGVLLNAKIGPLAFTPDAEFLSKMKEGAVEREFARQAARAVREYCQSAIIYAMKAAIGGMTSTLHTLSVWNATTRTNMSTALLAQALTKMADRRDIINSWLFRSESIADLLGHQLGQGVSGIADMASATGNVHTLGRKYATVDHATLTASDAGADKYYTVGMGPGFMEIEFVRGPKFYPLQWKNDTETVQYILRGDMDIAIRIPGMQYDSTNGGANPALSTTLATASNWDPTYGDHREVKAVIVEHNYSGN